MSVNNKPRFLYYLSSSEDDVAFYVGVTWSISKRLREHRTNNLKSGKNIFRYKKVKELLENGHSLQIRVIEENIPLEEVGTKEKEAISFFKTLGFPLTNLSEGGFPSTPSDYIPKKRVFTEEHKAAIGAAHKGKKLSKESIAKREATKKKNGTNYHPPEVIAKIAKALTGRTIPKDIVEKTAAANRGRKAPLEERLRRSEARKGYVHSEEAKAKMRESRNKFFLENPEERQRMTERQKGRKLSESTKQKISAAHLQRSAVKQAA